MKDKKLIKNARKPVGELGSVLLDRMNESHENLAIWGTEHLKINSNDIVLDIGCGGGVNLKRFAQIATNGEIHGIDYSDISVDKSIKLNEDLVNDGLVKVQEGSVSNLPFDDNYFDIITGFETVYFWPDFLNDLKEVYRVLKPGGTFLICNEASIKEESDKEKYKDIIELLDMNIYSENQLEDYLKKADFKDINIFKKDDWICTLASKK